MTPSIRLFKSFEQLGVLLKDLLTSQEHLFDRIRLEKCMLEFLLGLIIPFKIRFNGIVTVEKSRGRLQKDILSTMD